jgi:hypothetical protein
MEKRRFDELTVALARGGSRRGVLRSLAGGVLGALALDRSGALAKNENENNGRGKPITNPAKPICEGTSNPVENCPLCFAARDACCDPDGKESACFNCVSSGANDNCDNLNSPNGSCVTATCTHETPAGTRCEYTRNNEMCGPKAFCCSRFTHSNFGKCVNHLNDCR